jgi:hypothetical protein
MTLMVSLGAIYWHILSFCTNHNLSMVAAYLNNVSQQVSISINNFNIDNLFQYLC